MPMFKNIVCFFIHTFCLHSECLIGYYGINCSRKCPYPYFGTKCKHMCICPENNCNFALGCHTGKWIFIILTLNYDIGVCTLCCLNTELCECQQHKEQKNVQNNYIRVNNSKNEIYRCCANHWRGHWCECHGSSEMIIKKGLTVSQQLWHVKELSPLYDNECWFQVKICSCSPLMVISPNDGKWKQISSGTKN